MWVPVGRIFRKKYIFKSPYMEQMDQKPFSRIAVNKRYCNFIEAFDKINYGSIYCHQVATIHSFIFVYNFAILSTSRWVIQQLCWRDNAPVHHQVASGIIGVIWSPIKSSWEAGTILAMCLPLSQLSITRRLLRRSNWRLNRNAAVVAYMRPLAST